MFAALLAGFMTLVVSGVTTALDVGVPEGFSGRGLGAWLPTCGIAFPVLLAVRPIVHRVVARITA